MLPIEIYSGFLQRMCDADLRVKNPNYAHMESIATIQTFIDIYEVNIFPYENDLEVEQ